MISGVSFNPGQQGSYGNRASGPNARSSPRGVQEAIKILSLRLPKVVGPSAISPLSLLSSPGAGGLPSGVVDRVIQKFFPQTPSPTPQPPPPAPMPPPSMAPAPSAPSGGGQVWAGGNPFFDESAPYPAPPPLPPPMKPPADDGGELGIGNTLMPPSWRPIPGGDPGLTSGTMPVSPPVPYQPPQPPAPPPWSMPTPPQEVAPPPPVPMPYQDVAPPWMPPQETAPPPDVSIQPWFPPQDTAPEPRAPESPFPDLRREPEFVPPPFPDLRRPKIKVEEPEPPWETPQLPITSGGGNPWEDMTFKAPPLPPTFGYQPPVWAPYEPDPYPMI